MRFPAFLSVAAAALALSLSAAAYAAEPLYGVAMHGTPKYPADFLHFDYVNPKAPKGGTIHLAASGTFDSLNPFILKGVAAPGVGMIYQTLFEGSDDEAFTEYGQIAESLEMPDDRSAVTFNLRKEAKWHDGTPVTAADVVWTFETLMKDGHPHYRAYYGHVEKATAESEHRVRFDFDMAGNRELPLIMGQMPVLPMHFWKDKEFTSTSLDLTPLGSGPYKVKSVEAGRRITFERVKDWWAKDLPINKGRYNLDTIVYDLFRDETVLLEAFFSGNYDFRSENVAKSWATQYDRPPVKKGQIVKEEIRHELPAGMQAFLFNTRRPMFSDPKVREAINYAFDFAWSNKQFAYGAYTRTNSYFENSELASSGLPEGRELEILEKYKDQLPPDLFTRPFALPKTDGSGNIRANLRKAKELLEEAGWKIGPSGLLEKDGKPFKFEFLIQSEPFERWIQPMLENLKKLGIEGHLRYVDTAQYQNRMDNFDFDMTNGGFGQSLSPGNEQKDFWSAEKADVQGSRNLIGIKSPVVDELISLIISAPDRDELIVRTRALDRVLLWGWYVVPNWHHNKFRIAYWNKFDRPETAPKYGLGVPDTWWYDAEKAAKIKPSK